MKCERVLIVDSSIDNTKFLQQCAVNLQFVPANIKVVADGEEALKVAKEFRPQLVCTAWEIEPMPGTIFVQRLRKLPKCHYAPVLIYSERLTDNDIYLARELGLDGLVRLPFNEDQVMDTLKQMIEAEQNISKEERKLRKIEFAVDNQNLTEALGLVDSSLTKPGKHFVRAHTVLATLWFQLGKLDRAETMIKLALKEDAGYAPALQVIARIRSAQGQHEEAIQILQEMTELAPGNMTTMLNLGASYVDADRTEEAKDTLNELSALDPDDTSVKAELGKVAYKEGDHDRAKELMSQTGQGNKMAKFFNDIAIALVNKGEFEKGIKTYNDAVKILSDSSKLHLLHFNIGLAYRKKGDPEEAFKAFCDSFIENPSYEKAYANLVVESRSLKEQGLKPDPELVKKVKRARGRRDDEAA